MKATIEIEIDILMDSVEAIAAGLRAAADEVQAYTPIRKGVGTYLRILPHVEASTLVGAYKLADERMAA
jgi:hypothetical protein